MDGIRYVKLQGLNSDLRCEKLLDAAFSIPEYTRNFPHIFQSSSSASLFGGFDSSGRMIAMCAVDSEIWSEPCYLRGACIGSVAVHPMHQRRGFGQTLLKWVIDQLLKEDRYDFIYLFSDQPQFYESIGFRQCGTERLFAPRSEAPSPASHELIYRKPVLVSELTERQKLSLWSGLERGRLKGESHSCWLKFCEVVKIPEMLVSWIESSGGDFLAGAFVGKGVDFNGVAHTFFAENDLCLELFWREFNSHLKRTGSEVLVAPGLWFGRMKNYLDERVKQTLCLVYERQGSPLNTGQLIDDQKIYPRALFSS